MKPRRQAIYDPESRTYLIPLTRGKHAIVDLEDVEWLSQWDWHANSGGYAVRMDRANGKRLYVRMHRALAERWGWAIDGLELDHRNTDPGDNRRSNLRPATTAENRRNRGAQRNSWSGAKGVSWNMKQYAWEAKIQVDKRCIHLGIFGVKQDAIDAYAEAAKRYHGEFARWN